MNIKIKITIISLALFFSPSIAFGATEFVSIIDPDNGSGTDYTSLVNWEYYVDSDLTASNNKVFSHGGKTGAIADGASVTGATSGATGTVYHATNTQIYLNVTSGTFQSGEQVRVDVSNYVTISNAGDSAIAVASCRSSNGTADTTAVNLGGWTTSSSNYIKIWTDPSSGNRHDGVWDSNKYTLEVGAVMAIQIQTGAKHVIIDGLQISNSSGSGNDGAIYNRETIGGGEVTVKNNILKGPASADTSCSYCDGFQDYASGNGITFNVYNNIIMDYQATDRSGAVAAWNGSNTYNIYNNTLTSNNHGIYKSSGTINAKNNAIFNNTDDVYGTLTTFEYNACDDADCDSGTGNVGLDDAESDWDTIFVDNNNGDLHLSSKDIQLRDKGVDLSSAGVSGDIDGDTRPINSTWDIGADEAQIAIFRSVGPSATSALDNDNSQQDTLTITSGVGIFEVAVADNVGVGDVVVYDSDSDNDLDASDSIAFIKLRTDSTHYILQTQSGAIPADLAVNDKWAIYRAYASLANAESGTKNTSIPITFTGGDRDLVTNNEQWNIACYANGTTADATAVTVQDWTTGINNYIKIYTPVDATEVGASQKHSGVWNDEKYHLSLNDWSNYSLDVKADYCRIDGLQIGNTGSGQDTHVIFSNTGALTDLRLSGSIIKGPRVRYLFQKKENFARVWNNIFYDDSDTDDAAVYSNSWGSETLYLYNNTFQNNYLGVKLYGTGKILAKNNLFESNATDADGTFEAGTDYNSTDNSSIGYTVTGSGNIHDRTSQTISFYGKANDDFHLTPSDTSAKDAGTDLEADTYLPFSDDIDGASRDASINAWDIGADETATPIYRSVGPSATSALDNDNSHADTLTIGSGTATFEVAVADNIGVGDVLVVDTGGTDQTIDSVDTLIFIQGRTSSTVFTVKTHTGAVPSTSTTNNDTWQIYRAHTNLSNAEAGTINSTLSTLGFSFNGGDRELVTNNEQWNIATYANGATADTTAVTIDGWATGAQNYIRVYTPVSASEVGTSQRHSGVWGSSKYMLTPTADWNASLTINSDYLRVDGLQIDNLASSNADGLEYNGGGEIQISHNLIKGTRWGIDAETANDSTIKVWNNMIYDFSVNGLRAYHDSDLTTVIAYDNTFYNTTNSTTGIYIQSVVALHLKNNLVQNAPSISSTNYSLISNGSNTTANNLSEDGTSPDGASYQNKTVSFVDETNRDFHLSLTDTSARDVGTDLSSDTYLAFSDDIDGHTRGNNSAWDIGADEGSLGIYYSVGQDGTTDRKTGTPTMTISSGTATFSAAQTGNIGVGDVIDYDTDNKKLYIKSKTDTSNWKVVSVTGETPADVGTGLTVNSIKRVYSSLSSAEAGAPTLLGTSDLKTDNYTLNLPCYYDTGADTTAADIDGWATGQSNYIKIYTPNDTSTEANSSQRHGGKWDESKYGLVTATSNVIDVDEHNVRISGLQIETTRTADGNSCINVDAIEDIMIDSNIMRIANADSYGRRGIDVNDYGGGVSSNNGTVKIFNNIITEIGGTGYAYGISISVYTQYNNPVNAIVYNNTVLNADSIGILFRGDNLTFIARNNLMSDNGSDYATDDIAGGNYTTSNNATSDATSPDGASYQNKTFSFVDSINDDFHLSPTDTSARDAGTDLSADSNLAFSTDIDGETRPINSTWDIGADEAPTPIYRSVGPSATSALAVGTSNGLTIASSVATFASADLPTNVGVGDAIQYDSDGNNSMDSVVFIHSRTDARHFVVKKNDGSAPTDLASPDGDWSLFRAYTSLYNAERGNENDSIDNAVEDFDNWDGTGDYTDTDEVGRDIAVNSEQWNIACYADAEDYSALNQVYFSGWTTDTRNYINIFVPSEASEVGMSQRHNGAWDENKYILSGFANTSLLRPINNMVIDGLQIDQQRTQDSTGGIGAGAPFGNVTVKNCIIMKSGTGLGGSGTGIGFPDSGNNANNYVYNNIVYGFDGADGYGIYVRGPSTSIKGLIYNNTVYDNTYGIRCRDGYTYLKNNLAKNNDADYYSGGCHADSTNNAGEDAGPISGSGYVSISGIADGSIFADYVNGDFHLATPNNPATNAGTDLSSDANLHFSTDIDGETRPVGASWDIGADEYGARIKTEFQGNFEFQGGISIE